MYGNAPFSCYISHQPKVAKTERATFLFGAYSLVYTGRVMFHDFKPYIVDKLVTLDCIDSDPAGATDSMEILLRIPRSRIPLLLLQPIIREVHPLTAIELPPESCW